jgi:hypothetical protein
MEIDRRIPRIVGRFARVILARETLLARPRLEQGPVDGEMLGGQQATAARLRDDILKEGPRDVALEQPVAILGERRGHLHSIVHAQADKTAKQRLYSSCSINIRSLRTEYSTWSSSARNRCSGGIDGRPVLAYIPSNRGDNRPKALSVIERIIRSGWSVGTRCSGDR